MPPSKDKKGKSAGGVKKKKKAPLDALPPPRPLYGVGSPHANPERQLLSTIQSSEDFVFIRLKQADWIHGEFTCLAHAKSFTLASVARAIEARTGRMAVNEEGESLLTLYKHPPHERNILPRSLWNSALEQLGWGGGPVGEQVQVLIYYNYVPAAYSPVIQRREPQLMLEYDEEKGMMDESKRTTIATGEADFLGMGMDGMGLSPINTPTKPTIRLSRNNPATAATREQVEDSMEKAAGLQAAASIARST